MRCCGPHATNVIMPCGDSQYDDWKHTVMDSCVVMFMAMFSADSSMVRIWFWYSQDDVSITSPPTIWTMCHIGNDGMLGRHVIGSIRFQSSTLWLSAWIQYERIKSRSDGMNTGIWPVVHVSCDRLLERRLRAFWRYVCMCSLKPYYRGGARRLGDGLQNCFKRVRLPSPRPISNIWCHILIKMIIAIYCMLSMIDLASLHSCDIIVFVMNEWCHSFICIQCWCIGYILRSSTIGSCIWLWIRRLKVRVLPAQQNKYYNMLFIIVP